MNASRYVWKTSDEMFAEFIDALQDLRRDSHRRRELHREAASTARYADRQIRAERRFDAETERLRSTLHDRDVRLPA